MIAAAAGALRGTRRARPVACAARALCVALVIVACASTPTPEAEPVDDAEVLAFAERVGGFYQAIAGRPLNTLLAFEDPELRRYFADPSDFADYYASLVNQLEHASFRYARADAVHVREFRFASPERAQVDLTLVGRHERSLRFWNLEVERTDSWKRSDQGWVLDPDRL